MLSDLQAERQALAIEAASVPHMTAAARKQVLDRYAARRAGATRSRTLVGALAEAGIAVVDEPKDVKRGG